MEHPMVEDPHLINKRPSYTAHIPPSAALTESEEDYDPSGSAALPPVKIDYVNVFSATKAGFAANALPQVNHVIEIIYTMTSKILYSFLIIIIGIILSLVWAILFTFTSFFNNWVVNPCMRLSYICLLPYMGMYRATVVLYMEPCFSAMAFALSRIKATLLFKPYPALLREESSRGAIMQA
eukprot:m.309373 g.309373  ORF g.309373 m.309373 type:complete len:181 (+) comp46261_c0_seq1:45-587(+)